MPVLYSAILLGTTTLVDAAAFSGNFKVVAKEFLDKTGSNQGRYVFPTSGHEFCFLTKNGFTYLAVADQAFGRNVPYAFLEKLDADFAHKFMGKAQPPREGMFADSYGKQLRGMMTNVNQKPAEFDALTAVKEKVEETKNIMLKNMEMVLVRGEKLAELDEKAAHLKDEADRFKNTSSQVKRTLQWQNIKMKLMLLGALLLLGLVLFLVICFSTGCFKKD
mmetsp:Transcript_23421/g.51416  ORF Transcript_23421/g.51416 Transcript_23421/m.51416 type:complete len:220 (+) Transcript_23421:146-805(+)